MSLDRLDPDAILAGLKDFQRRTVEHVFGRLWTDDPPTPRFLVADEVGLGKTLVARGVIARTLEHLRDRVERIDVVYVCSNGAIAQQNVNRLNVLGDETFSIATRLTLLPLQLHELDRNRVNFVSFTPGTTFDLKSRGGRADERAVLYRLLAPELPHLEGSLLHLLRGGMRFDRFRARALDASTPLDGGLGAAFVRRVRAEADLLERLEAACARFAEPRPSVPPEDRAVQYEVIGRLRQLLARVCVDALEPDLVILDEFQRFRDLLDGSDEAAELARSLMTHRTPEGHDVRVLLLSATPYKPLTLAGEEEDHHEDFLRTLGFLFDDPGRVAQLQEHLRTYRHGLYAGEGDGDHAAARRAVERMLRSVMVRTERVGRTEQRDAMMTTERIRAPLTPGDLAQARRLTRVAEAVGARDAVEYWKSAPHLLHFMKGYRLKEKLEDAAHDPPPELIEALGGGGNGALTRREVGAYRELEPANGRLRALLERTVERGQWRLLWVPPSLPYLEPGGAYAEVEPFTKALVFSSWNVVPDALAAMCSYAVERRMVRSGGAAPHYRKLHDARSPLLRFHESDGRLSGMANLALFYPSVALTDAVDPLRIALEVGEGGPAPVEEVRRRVARIVEELLRMTGLWPRGGAGPADQRWYWAALAILDRPHLTGLRHWLSGGRGWRAALGGVEDRGLKTHVDQFRQAAEGALDEELGPAPEDLVDVLVDLALGSPAVCAARALRRVAPGLDAGDRRLSHGAAAMAGGFRTLYNLPETIALLRSREDDAYWRLVLGHGIDGNLQSVLDEYVHHLVESLGLSTASPKERVAGVAEAVAEALSIRTVPIAADEIRLSRSGRIRLKRFRFRTRFALRFGDLKDDQERTIARAGAIRTAFNSPFRPFVLASTSVGQEGLDFHPYCHAVYHWNLPSNPVDMEQREGRVHRYKGHAVRRNVAERWGLEAVAEGLEREPDPWKVLFAAAATDRPEGASELIPYWIYEIPGGARVERRVPMFPFSREEGKLARLQRGLAVYRMAFGQPRQEDLVELLAEREGRNGGAGGVEAISLEPPGPRADRRFASGLNRTTEGAMSNRWIFQANPDRYDIDRALEALDVKDLGCQG